MYSTALRERLLALRNEAVGGHRRGGGSLLHSFRIKLFSLSKMMFSETVNFAKLMNFFRETANFAKQIRI
jgi:hypothetical protein